MAIDKHKTQELLDQVKDLFEVATAGTSPAAARFLREHILGEAIGTLEQLVTESRAPVLYIMGRSGHGKSTLINALANRQVAPVGRVRPITPGSERHQIKFEDRYAEWDVIDSRGIFETTRPDGAPEEDAVEQVRADVAHYRPDVIFYAITAPETRAMARDLHALASLGERVRLESGVLPPAVLVLTKADTVDPVREAWPPRETGGSERLEHLLQILDYVAAEGLAVAEPRPIESRRPWRGVNCGAEGMVRFTVPVGVPPGDEPSWNVETLSGIVGELIPPEAQLFFYQAQRRKVLLKQMSTSLIKRFSKAAGGIGMSPVPIADLAVLAPLQMLMIACIGGLSCREFSRATAREFLAASGINLAGGYAFRELARQIVKIVPGYGWAVSGGVAAAGTYCIGKSAEAYFFHGEWKDPQEFQGEAPEGLA